MRSRSLTTLPFLVAFLVGIAAMALSVYDIHAREIGTLDVGHLTGASLAGLALTPKPLSLLTDLFHRMRNMLGDERGEVAAELLAPVSGIKALKQRAADLIGAMKALQTKLGDSKLSAEARAEAKADFKTLETLADENDEQLKSAERLVERERTLSPVTDPDAQASRQAAAAARVEVHNRAEDDPKRGFKDHREYLRAVMAAGRNPTRIDQRLLPLQATQGSDEQGVYSDPHGGFLVPHGIAPGILSIAPEADPIEPLLTPVPMSAPTVSFNARVDKNHATSVSGGFIVTRRPETVDGSATRQAYEQVTLVANEEFGLAVATERILTDSPMSFVAIIQAGFRDEYVANGMKERIEGTGVGERQGALNAGCKIAVAKEAGQKAASIVKENIDKMASRCWRYSRGVWIANHNTRPQLAGLVQVVGTGGNAVPYFRVEGAPVGFDAMLNGRPLLFTEFAKGVGTEGDLILIVPSEYLEGTYQSEQYAESIHVRFAAAERMFRFYRRNDGQWWWRTALTPKYGDTLSPVVTLAARA